MVPPLLFKLSWISPTSLANNQTKHSTLSGIFDFQIPLHSQWLWGWLGWFAYLKWFLQKKYFQNAVAKPNILTLKSKYKKKHFYFSKKS